MQHGHHELLELATRGAPLPQVLDELVRLAAAVAPEAAAAVFLLQDDGSCLRFHGSHELPASYAAGVDPFPVGPDHPACGRAAWSGKPEISADLREDPAWAPYLLLARAHDIRACWSFPLCAGTRVLGTLAVYHHTPQAPDDGQRQELTLLTQVASLVLSRDRESQSHAVQREAAERTLRDTNRRKDVFFAILGHELRNPIGTLRNSWHILQRHRASLPEPAPRLLDVMHGQIDQLVRLTDDLLDASRIAQGKLDMRMERMELHAAVEQAVESARPLCAARRQSLEWQPLGTRVWVVADGARVTQMVTNLLTNACKFTPDGGAIRVVLERQGEQAVVRVRDNGAGIAAEEQARIFEMFAQLDEGKKFGHHQGLGIGLPLVRKLALLQGGTVSVDSAGSGRGSEFTIRLPARP